MFHVFKARSWGSTKISNSRKMSLMPALYVLTFFLSVANCFMGIETQNTLFNRNRRDVLTRIFVVRRSSTGGLFSLASVPAVQSEVFQFILPAPAGLLLDSASGLVSRSTSAQLNAATILFSVQRNSTISAVAVSDTIQVTVQVVDRGDTDPIFTNMPMPLWTTCPVWIRPQTVIYTLQSIDQFTHGTDVRYRLESGGNGMFDVNPMTGDIFIVGRRMFIENSTFSLAVSAQAFGAFNTISTPAQIVNIQVGYRPPQPYFSPYNVTFFENSSAMSVVATLHAKSFQGLPLQYTMSSTDSLASGNFGLNINTGELTLLNTMTYAFSQHLYTFSLTVTEMYSNFSTTVPLTVYLLAVNHSPFFGVLNYVVTNFLESSPVGAFVTNVVAIDLDPGALGSITYTVSNPLFTAVTNDNGTASILVNGTLDYDYLPRHMYEFSIIATDGGNPPLSGSTNIQVWLKNVNDEAPVFDPPNQGVQVKKTAARGMAIYYIQGYDPDGCGLTFQLNSNNNDRTVQQYMNVSGNGQITLIQSISRDFALPSFNVSVIATDDGSCCDSGQRQSTVASIIVTVLGVNQQPTFPDCYNYRATVYEKQQANTPVLSMTAVDNDAGDNGRLAFSVVYISSQTPVFGVRTSSSNPKVAELYTLVPLNRDQPDYSSFLYNGSVINRVTVKVSDFGSPPLSTNCFLFVTILDTNDNRPAFDYDVAFYFTITNTLSLFSGSRIYRVYAHDIDNGVNGSVVYSLTSVSPTCSNCFTVDSSTGWIRRGSQSAAINTYILNITASDQGTPALSISTNVTIQNVQGNTNQQLPTWQNISSIPIDDFTGAFVLENATTQTLLNVSPNLSATIASSTPAQYFLSNDGRFPMLNSDGSFTVRSPFTNPNNIMPVAVGRSLDASVVSTYVLRLRAFVTSSSNQLAAVARLRVNIGDVNDKQPIFQGTDENGIYPAAVSSYTNRGDLVIYVTAIDEDRDAPNNVVTYSFASSCSQDCASFLIDSNTGRISSNVRSFDASMRSSYLLQILATDGAPSSITAIYPAPNQALVTVRVTVTGVLYDPPFFPNPSYTLTINEGQSLFTNLLNVTATIDPRDIAQYQIESGNTLRRFAVNSSTGYIYNVGELLVNSQNVYNLTYRVFDGVVDASTIITVTLIPQNLNPPVFNPISFNCNNLTEKSQTGAMLTLTADDPDRQRTGLIAYSLPYSRSSISWSSSVIVNTQQIFQSIVANSFSLNPAGGFMSLTQVLGRDIPSGFPNWQFNVAANDEAGSSTSLVGYGLVNLVLQDINDNSPVFDTCCLNGSVPEGAPAGFTVMQLYATDVDAGVNGTVSYSLVTSSPLFSLSPSGLLVTTQTGATSLNRELLDTYYLTVRACDGGTPSRCVTTQVTIKVLDSNDNTPSFTAPTFSATIPELLPIGSSVVAVTATDLDTSSRLTFAVSTGSGSQYFYADSVYSARTGVIRMQQILRATAESSTYNFGVTTSDGSNQPATASVSVTVLDINDRAPVFSSTSYSKSISRSVAVGTSLLTVSATDADFGMNKQFTFHVDYANTDPLYNFNVNPTTGVVSVRSTLSPDTKRFINLNILAIDEGKPSLTGSVTVAITVTDSNDNAPSIVFDPAWPLVVRADAQAGQTVFCFNVTQDIVSQNSVYGFSYVCNSVPCRDFSLVIIATNRACLTATRSNYARKDLGYKSYSISVNVSDNSTPVQWALRQFTLIVESTNDNPPKPGVKTIVVNTLNGVFSDVPLGNVFVDDPDDWDLSDETFRLVSQDNFFTVDTTTGQISMKAGTTKGNHSLSISVSSLKWQITVNCTVNIVVRYYNDSAIKSAASLRLSGVADATSLLSSTGSSSQLNSLQQQIAVLIGTSASNVDILSVQNSPDSQGSVDVTFTAHGSPYYTSEKLNSIVAMNSNAIQQATGLTVGMSPVDLCAVETADCSGGCNTLIFPDPSPLLININSSSFAGVNVSYVRSCKACDDLNTRPWTSKKCSLTSCLNGGTCQQYWNGYKCSCPLGYDGPRCQVTKITFTTSSGYALIKPLQNCGDDKLSFEFITKQSTGSQLLMYAGSMSGTNSVDFISVELVNGFPKLRVNLGDGELILPATSGTGSSFPSLADGNWHSVEIYRTMNTRQIRLVIDHCINAVVSETIDSSTEDRSKCDFSATASGDRFLLSVSAAVQLGGRISPSSSYPAGLTQTGFQGCIKNFIQNGELFDLHLASARLSAGAQDGCSSEQCSQCPGNSTCIGNLNGAAPKCTCLPGLRGAACDQFTTVKELTTSSSYTEWSLRQPDYNNSVNVTSQKNAEFSLKFRTRQTDGMIFYVSSFSGLEHAILEIVDSHLQFRFDLGSDDRTLLLSTVNVSDGEVHFVNVKRYGNQVILQLDAGEGPLYAEYWPSDEHRLLRVGKASGGGEVVRNVWTNAISVKSIRETCIEDVRYASTPFPLDAVEYSSSIPVTIASQSMSAGCNSGACNNLVCQSGQFCYDMWRVSECRCTNPSFSVNPSTQTCQVIPDCSVPHCVNGDCVVVGNNFTCNCFDGWTSLFCEVSIYGPSTAANEESTFNRTAAIAAPVVIGILLLAALIILLVFLLMRRRKPEYLLDEPDKEFRENIVAYDEEGAGEEDNLGYDLSRLQKPVNFDMDGVDNLKQRPELSRSATPMIDQRTRRPPGSYPNVGDLIDDRLRDADADQPPNDDALHGFDNEGTASEAGTLSSIGSGSSAEDQDFGFLNNWGPPFRKLADLYGNDDAEDDDAGVSNV